MVLIYKTITHIRDGYEVTVKLYTTQPFSGLHPATGRSLRMSDEKNKMIT